MTADRARGALAVLQDADGKFICEVPCGYIVEQTGGYRHNDGGGQCFAVASPLRLRC